MSMNQFQAQATEATAGNSVNFANFFDSPQGSLALSLFFKSVGEQAKSQKDNQLKLAFLFGFTYPGRRTAQGLQQPTAEGLRRTVGDEKQHVTLGTLDFIEQNSDIMEQFLKQHGYTCYPLVDETIKEGELKEIGRQIKGGLQKLQKRHPSLHISVVCFFAGHGAICKQTQSQVLYLNSGKYLRFEDFMYTLISAGAENSSTMQFIGLFNCCRTILSTERADDKLKDQLQKVISNHEARKSDIKKCSNFALIFSCLRGTTAPATGKTIEDFIAKYNNADPFDVNANEAGFYTEISRITKEAPLFLSKPKKDKDQELQKRDLHNPQDDEQKLSKDFRKLAVEEEKKQRVKTIDKGNEVRLGTTGKYYCGGRLEGTCDCCNGFCGPTNGCNCSSCMKLDIKSRDLPIGCYVNKEGYPCKQGQVNAFYCGRKVLVGVKGCDGYCGPDNGPNCKACQLIGLQRKTRYKNI